LEVYILVYFGGLNKYLTSKVSLSRRNTGDYPILQNS